jgi:poly(hydroxyalkanoate) depolymerase family esterase
VKITGNLLEKMREATRQVLDGKKDLAAAAIQRALHTEPSAGSLGGRMKAKVQADSNGGGSLPDFVPDLLRQLGISTLDGAPNFAPGNDEPATHLPGRFLPHSFTNSAGTRAYKVYVPGGHERKGGKRLPVVVMLHGCTQNPDDFAAGTKMNAIAEREQCLVVYPAQSQSANHSHCWNWFNPGDQKRDAGEPSIIAGITRAVIDEHHGDPERVYVAGLSAGGAMALIMGATYPELYAAVGVHSGLPHGSAHDVQSAFAAMQGNAKANNSRRRGKSAPTVQAIVFHGDRDTTVHPHNADEVLAQTAANAGGGIDQIIVDGRAKDGRAYTQTIHRNAQGQTVSEQWVVHGAGHAWSGGSGKGSYTDPSGPDAGEEMMRFFHTRHVCAA